MGLISESYKIGEGATLVYQFFKYVKSAPLIKGNNYL